MRKAKPRNERATSSHGFSPEALTWPFGAALVGLWLLTYTAGLWWVTHSAVQQGRDAEVRRVEALANNLSSSIEPLLATGELSAVRRLVSEAGYRDGLESCQLLLGDGRPLADADLNKPQLTVMPADWPAAESADPSTRVVGGRITVDRSVPVPGRGLATLTVVSLLPPANAVVQPMLPGAGLVGVIGLAGVLVLYRKLRGRLMVLALIRGALRDAAEGEPDPSALAVNPAWGKEADGWNRILAQHHLACQVSLDHELEAIGARVGSVGAIEDACNGMWDGMLVTDARGRVNYLNGAAAAALGIELDASYGAAIEQLIQDEHLNKLIGQVLSGTGPGKVTHVMQPGGEQQETWIKVTARRLTDSGGMMLLAEDITQQRVAESSRHDFVTRATHELRTPLTNIRLYVETAQEDGQNDPELRGECLNVISRESQRLERLVTEMLSVSEIEAGSMTMRRDDVRLDQLFKALQQDYLANAQEKKIDLRFELPPKLPAIQGDRDKLSVVLQNLLGNAIKYTPEGGNVTVGVDISATALNVEVRDTGIGIGEADLPKVFEKFYRANDPRLGDITGSGLGLALAHEIVRLHGGELTVESVLNEGSTFRVALPINAEGV